MTKQELGKIGENSACDYLLSHGYSIIERNYHSRYGEIDIIAKDEKTLVFAEVKLRSAGSLVRGREAVTPSKMKKLIKTAALWLGSRQITLPARFDVIEVFTKSANSGEVCGIEHIPSAFDMEVCGEIF